MLYIQRLKARSKKGVKARTHNKSIVNGGVHVGAAAAYRFTTTSSLKRHSQHIPVSKPLALINLTLMFAHRAIKSSREKTALK